MGMDLNPRIGYFINQELSKDSLKRMGRLICDQWHALQTILNYTCLCPITWKVPIGPHPSIFCTVQAKSNDQLHLFEKQKQDITIDNYVHRRLGLIKENSDYSWSTNLICHCFPLLSTSFANLKHGRTTEKNIYRSKGETGRTKNRPSYLIILLHTSRIDLTSGFCSWNSLRKSSLANKDITQLGTGNGTWETCSFPI